MKTKKNLGLISILFCAVLAACATVPEPPSLTILSRFAFRVKKPLLWKQILSLAFLAGTAASQTIAWQQNGLCKH